MSKIEGTEQLNIRVPVSLLARLKRRKRATGKTVRELVLEALRAWLGSEK